MSKRPRAIPQAPKPIILDATIAFHTRKGDIALDWSATNGDVTHNGALIHNTNDLALLHTIAKGILATKD
jgi:hypothetical protein